MNLSLILFNTSCGMYSILKKLKYTAVFLSINNETQCVPLLCLSSEFIAYLLPFNLGILSLEKTPLQRGS